MNNINTHLQDFKKFYPDFDIQNENMDNLRFHWEDIQCTNFPKVEEIRGIVNQFVDKTKNKSLCDDLVTIFYELITNAFRSQADYKIRSEIYQPDHFVNQNEFIVEKQCTKCTKVTIHIFKIIGSSKIAFKIVNKGKIHKESIDRIKKVMTSDNIMKFPNYFTIETGYDSFTGVSGIGLFTIKNILENDYNTKLHFEIKEDEITFFSII